MERRAGVLFILAVGLSLCLGLIKSQLLSSIMMILGIVLFFGALDIYYYSINLERPRDKDERAPYIEMRLVGAGAVVGVGAALFRLALPLIAASYVPRPHCSWQAWLDILIISAVLVFLAIIVSAVTGILRKL